MEDFEKNTKQLTEGILSNYTTLYEEEMQEYLRENLPSGISPEMVDRMIGGDGKWHWHLRPEYIKDEEERKKYEADRKAWSWH